MTKLQNIKLGIYEKAIPYQLGWKEKMETAKNAGYDFIELSIDGLEPRISRLDWDDNEINEIRRASEETGVPLLTMAFTANRYYPLGDPEKRERGIEIVKKAIDLAVRLGIRIMQLAPYDVQGDNGTDHNIALFMDSLRKLVPYAAEHGIILTIEVMPDVRYCGSVTAVRKIIEEIDSPFLQIYADTGNAASRGIDPASDILTGGTHLVASHIKDATPGCSRNVEYGKGIVDFDACMRSFKKMDFHGFFVAEMWSEEDESFIPYLATAADFIRARMEAADAESL